MKLDPVELSFQALHSDTTSQVISILCVLQKAIPEKHFRNKFQELLPYYPRLHYLLKGNDWVLSKNFNPQDNVNFVELSASSNFINFCEEQFSKKLDQNLPPWKINAVSGNGHAIHFIFHHSLADGMGIIDLIKDLSDHKTTTSQKAVKINSKIKSHRLEAIKLIIDDFLRTRACSPINGDNSSTRKFTLIQLPLAEINQARKLYRVSLHEYMTGVVTRALEKFFNKKDFEKDNINILIPVSHRHPKSTSKLGNFITGLALEFNLKHKSNENHLTEIKEKFRKSMNHKKDEVYIYLASQAAKLPSYLRKILCNFSANRTNVICSSVPGKEELSICGAKVIYKYGTVALMKGHGISFAFTRYLDNMCICMVNDPKIINNPREITDLLIESHAEFYKN